MGQLGRSGDTLVDIVADVFTGVSSALQTIKNNVGEFVEGVKTGLDYIPFQILNEILEAIESGTNSFIYGIGKIMEQFISGFTVTKNNLITYNNNGQNYQLGFGNNNFDIDLELGFITLSLRELFGDNPKFLIDGQDIVLTTEGEINRDDPFLDPPKGFARIAWKYIVMELIKEVVLTILFTAWQAMLVMKKPQYAIPTHISLLAVSYYLSTEIFEKIKNDLSLSPADRHATIYQMYNIHLDFALSGGVDLILELGNEIFNDGEGDLSKFGFAVDAILVNYFQGRYAKQKFEEWNPGAIDIWSTGLFDNLYVTFLETILILFGGLQMNYLFDTGYKVIEIIKDLPTYFKPNTGIFGKIRGLYKIINTILFEDIEAKNPYKFGYAKFFYGALLMGYHSGLTYMWGHAISNL